MKSRIFLLLIIVFSTLLMVGCPGNRQLDKDANETLWAWVEEQDAAGWEIMGVQTATPYKNVVVDHIFKPTRLELAIHADAVNPFHQRNMIETIARKWRECYPSNLRPRFNLRVELYDMEITRDNDLGWSEIDTDGNVDTHHSKTQDVM